LCDLCHVNASTGAPIQVPAEPSYALDFPAAIAADNAHIWVASQYGNTVTELPATAG
jgi:hypothetical protein